MPEPSKTEKQSALKKRQQQDEEEVNALLERQPSTLPIPDCSVLRQLEEKEKTSALRQLSEAGIALLPGLVDDQVCRHLLASYPAFAKKQSAKKTLLTETSGGGERGGYFANDWGKSEPILRDITRAIVRAVGLRGTAAGEAGEIGHAQLKAVLLNYVEGGRNYTHQDDNAKWDYQALLMLSEPEQDFKGGELYVMKVTDDDKTGEESACVTERAVAFKRRGDVVIFRSNGPFFHGMREVKRGNRKMTERVAVGLMHKNK